MDLLLSVLKIFSKIGLWNKEKHVGVITEGGYKLKEYIDNAEERGDTFIEQMRGDRI